MDMILRDSGDLAGSNEARNGIEKSWTLKREWKTYCLWHMMTLKRYIQRGAEEQYWLIK